MRVAGLSCANKTFLWKKMIWASQSEKFSEGRASVNASREETRRELTRTRRVLDELAIVDKVVYHGPGQMASLLQAE